MHEVINPLNILRLSTKQEIMYWLSHYAAQVCYNLVLGDAERDYLHSKESEDLSLIERFEEINRDYHICLRALDKLAYMCLDPDKPQNVMSVMPDLLGFVNLWNGYQQKWKKFDEDFLLLFFMS